MSIELARRIKALEARVSEMQAEIAKFHGITDLMRGTVATPSRALCPKCGVKPNHFFHVKNCAGQKEKQNDGDDKRRYPGAT
jgi:hypothetical protein